MSTVAADLDFRLLRHFVAVAEELHFSRAASRLFVAQQALSRDVSRLEERVGVPLLDRTTRRVVLTDAGERLLVRARQLLALHDDALRELRGDAGMCFVDVVGPGLTPSLLLDAARASTPGYDYFARFHEGLAETAPLVLARRLDAAFGRFAVLGNAAGLAHRLVRWEPMALLLPDAHRLADRDEVPLDMLAEIDICWRSGDHASPEWDDAALQLLKTYGATPSVPHPHVRGADELAHHVRQRDVAVLTVAGQPPVPGAVVRPLVDPVPVYPWSMLWRDEPRGHPGLEALHKAADAYAAKGWLELPADAWLPAPEASEIHNQKW